MELPHRRRSSAGGLRVTDGAQIGAPEAGPSSVSGDGFKASSSSQSDSLRFLHRIRTPSSILALAVDDHCVFAGLQGGKIQVCLNQKRQALATLINSKLLGLVFCFV
jgi:hypothetical protein